MTQEFHISVTPIGADEYLVRTERVAPGVPLAEEQVNWPVDEWLDRAALLMHDPIAGLLRSDAVDTTDFSRLAMETGLGDDQNPRSMNLRLFGQQLYNALFQGTIRDSWMTAQGIAQHRQQILRLRLGLKDTRLPRLPWEVLHAGDRPLATRTDIVFSRYHSSFAVMSSAFQFLQQLPIVEPGQPLKILLVLAAPSDQEMLALRQEALHLQDELQATQQNGKGSSEIQLTLLEQPGREQLTQALEHNNYQVLHYAGHSNLGTAGGKLYLVSSKTGLTETLSGDDLAGLLVNNGIRMAVFNSCRGVYTAATESGGESGEGNLAEALFKRGIPAVLAMAERIPDDVALNLSRLLYRNLKQLYPIDLSLNRARQGLLSSYGSNQMYWALPILYLHPEFDGCLLSPSPEAERTEALSEQAENAAIWETEAISLNAEMANDFLPEDRSDYLSDNDEWAELDEDSLPDTDDLEALEFDDPEYSPELETVAQLVQQLSQASSVPAAEDALLPALPSENLLPEVKDKLKPEEYLILPDRPYEISSRATEGNVSVATAAETAIASQIPLDSSVYLELEQLLAESGKPTEAISACNRAIQENPNNAQAYDRLGMTLFEQGYVAEAIAAYQQAIRISPVLAEAHHHLGQALYLQGNVREAIRACSRAVELNPNLTEARRHLELALHRHGVKLPPEQQLANPIPPQNQPWDGRQSQTSESSRLTLTPSVNAGHHRKTEPSGSPPSANKSTPKPLLWAGAGVVGVTTLFLGVWLLQDRVNSALVSVPILAQLSPQSANSTTDLKQVSTQVVTALATEQLSQGDIRAAQPAIEALLDRGALTQAATALTPILKTEADNPTVNFWMGRLAWQFVKSGNRLYSLNDARRAWEKAAQRQPTALYQNSLAFAYYDSGDLKHAGEAWLRGLQMVDSNPESTRTIAVTTRSSSSASQEELTARAGLALVRMKWAERDRSRRTTLQSEAIDLRQRVMTTDPDSFQPSALAKNWQWSETAIQDWQKLLSLRDSSSKSFVK